MAPTSQTEGDFDLWFSYYCEDDSSPYHVAWVDFRYVDGNNMAYLAISPIGMYLDSVVSGSYTTVASNYDEDTVDGQWYDMYIQCSGETVEVWRGLQGEALERVLKADNVEPTSTSKLRLSVYLNGTYRFDNIRLQRAGTAARSFEDDFEDGDYGNDPEWDVELGGWSVGGTTEKYVYDTTSDRSLLAIGNTAADYQADFLYTPTDTSGSLAVHLRHVDGDNWLRLTFESGLARLAQTFENTYSSLAVNDAADSDVDTQYAVSVLCDGSHVEVWRGLPGEDMTRILSGTPTVIPAQAGSQDTTLPAVIPAQAGTQDTTPPPSFPRKREPSTEL